VLEGVVVLLADCREAMYGPVVCGGMEGGLACWSFLLLLQSLLVCLHPHNL
jgi:hypothetical protein